MEQELFIGWAPEDSERQSRFRNLGYKVMHLDGCYIYHIEHSRGINSSKDNPMFKHNEQLYKKLSTMTPDQLREYYKNVEYIKKYRK